MLSQPVQEGVRSLPNPKSLRPHHPSQAQSSTSAGNHESASTQILRQVLFHLHPRIKWHRVQVDEKFREQTNAIPFRHCRSSGSRCRPFGGNEREFGLDVVNDDVVEVALRPGIGMVSMSGGLTKPNGPVNLGSGCRLCHQLQSGAGGSASKGSP